MYGRSAGVQCSSQPHGFSIRFTYGESENSERSNHGKGLFTPELSFEAPPGQFPKRITLGEAKRYRGFTGRRLALGVLSGLAGTLETVLLALLHAGVARQQAVTAQLRL
jgi:hypothetical protein